MVEHHRELPHGGEGRESGFADVIGDEVAITRQEAAMFGWEFLSNGRTRAIIAAVLAVVLVVCAILLANVFSNQETYAGIVQSLDDKESTVMTLVASSAAVSTAVSLAPGDAGTPLADKLMDLSADFTFVLAAIYLEKYLLTIAGLVTFRFIFPLACIAGMLMMASFQRPAFFAALKRLAAKLFLLGVVLVATVPASVALTDSIEGIYEESINNTIATAESISEEANTADQEEYGQGANESNNDNGANDSSADESNGSFFDFFLSIPDNVANGVSEAVDEAGNALTGAVDEAQNAINGFVEALAVMLVTSCVIPLLVLLLFLWVAKLVLGINVDVPLRMLRTRRLGR